MGHTFSLFKATSRTLPSNLFQLSNSTILATAADKIYKHVVRQPTIRGRDYQRRPAAVVAAAAVC